MNKRGNIMLNLLFFMMGLAVLVLFIGPMNTFIGFAEGSNNLNCNGYVDPSARASQNYSYNASLPSSTTTCLALNMYLPYIVLVFLVAGVSRLIYERTADFGGSSDQGGFA